MADNLSGQQVVEQASPTPENASVPAEQQSQETQKPLTIQDIERIVEDRATRIAQSMVDKAEYRISQRAQQQIQALELNKSTLGLSDQQVKDAKQKIVMDDLTAEPQGTQASNPLSSQGQPQDYQVSESDMIGNLFTAFEVKPDPNDPEYADFKKVYDANYNNPNGLPAVLRAVSKYEMSKTDRLQRNQNSAEARVLQGGGSTADPSDISNVVDSEQLYMMGERKLRGRA